MAVEVTLEIVTIILSVSAIVVGLQIIPKIKSDLIKGWRWLILAIFIFVIGQLYIVLKGIQQEAALAIIDLLFIVILNVGLAVHLISIESKERRR